MPEEQAVAQSSSATRNGVSLSVLKYIAIVAMAIDHTASAFVPSNTVLYLVLRFIGRITGPVMFFAAAEGYHHTRNINRYMVRLAVFALVSYFPFMFFENGGALTGLNFLQLNVIYTIFLGVTAIRVRREINNPVLKTFLIFCLIVVSIPGDWGVIGILMMLAFDYFSGDFKNQALGFCLIVLLGVGVINLITNPVSELVRTHRFSFSLMAYGVYIINAGQFLPIILLRFYNGTRGRGGRFAKWVFYIFYPAHLLVLGLLQLWLK